MWAPNLGTAGRGTVVLTDDVMNLLVVTDLMDLVNGLIKLVVVDGLM